jgi:hypothetical protein
MRIRRKKEQKETTNPGSSVPQAGRRAGRAGEPSPRASFWNRFQPAMRGTWRRAPLQQLLEQLLEQLGYPYPVPIVPGRFA